MSLTYSRSAFLATLLALVVVMLGAYTRLSNAGLGCPDWPGCYAHFTVPSTSSEIQAAADKFPGQVVEAPKAWKEMVHRYFAGSLGLLILILAVWGVLRARQHRHQPVLLPLVLVMLVIFQVALGMWTVTWKVLPVVVSAHLLCGLTIAALLWYLTLVTRRRVVTYGVQALYLKPWVMVGLGILIVQLLLGAWTSTTYSALACHDFPFCHGSLWPKLELQQAFEVFQPIGINYEGGVLETPVRITIQMMHRYGAFVTAVYLSLLAVWIIFANKTTGLRGIAGVLLLVLAIQVLLGIGNVMLSLPLWTAVAHNGVAAVLLLTLVTLVYKLKSPPQLKF